MQRFVPVESNWSIGDNCERNALKDTVNSVDKLMKCDEILFLTPRELRAQSIPNYTNVCITSIVNHKTVFVRPSFASANEFMCQLFDDIDHEGKLNFRPLNELPKCGGIYLVNFEDEFYRVYVLAATSRNHKIDIFFVDFGNIDGVWLSQLSELSDELTQRSILLNRICLAHVPEITFNDNPLRFLNQLCDDEVEMTLIIDQKATRGSDKRESYRMMPKFCHLQFANEVLTVNRKLIRLNSNAFSVDVDKCNTNHLLPICLPIFIYVSAFLSFDFIFVAFTSNVFSYRISHIYGMKTQMWKCKFYKIQKLIHLAMCRAFDSIRE